MGECRTASLVGQHTICPGEDSEGFLHSQKSSEVF